MKQSRIIILVTLLLTACSSFAAKRTAEFQGIRFAYDPALFTTVEAQTVPGAAFLGAYENETTPHHISFALTSYRPQHQKRFQKPAVAVYSTADFKQINAYFSQEALPALSTLLSKQPAVLAPELKLPLSLPNCCFAHMQVMYLRFQNGVGVRFVSYIRAESIQPIANVNLYYIFYGLTDGGQYYISALFPLDVSFLPEHPTDEVAVIPTRAANNTGARINATLTFNEEVEQKMTELDSADFTPRLESLDEMIQSLQVK